MMYLENILEELKEKANVCVMLSSVTEYCDGEFKMQDGCGNHYTENWKQAIDELNYYKVFVVEKVDCKLEDYMDGKPQWTITLTTGKNEQTKWLDYQSNAIAVSNAFRR